MPISASNIVSIVPRILKGTGSDLVFNGLVLSKNSRLAVNAPTAYSSASAVASAFGEASDEYKFAQVYFGGYKNSQIKPSVLYFYRYCDTGVAPFVRGTALKPSTALASLKQISNGAFSVTLTGKIHTVSSLDLSSASSLSEVADKVQEALRDLDSDSEDAELSGLTVAFDSVTNAFTITNGTSSSNVSVDTPTGDVALAMGFTADACVVSEGSDSTTLSATLNKLTLSFQNFVTFTTLWEASDDEALELGEWATANASAGVCYLYVLWDSSKENADSNSKSIIAEKLITENIAATTVVYDSYRVAAFIMGAAASIAWDNKNSTITFAFKSQDGLGANVLDTDEANALEGHKVNFIGNYATRNDNFVWLYSGRMLGEWDWIDTYLNSIWLCNAMQVQVMAGFEAVRRVPYTLRGYAMIRSWLRDVINRAKNNGVIEAGVSLSETQKSSLIEELGADYSDEIYNNGYYLQILDPSAQTRQQRKSPSCNLVYTYGGAVHRLTMPSIAVV